MTNPNVEKSRRASGRMIWQLDVYEDRSSHGERRRVNAEVDIDDLDRVEDQTSHG